MADTFQVLAAMAVGGGAAIVADSLPQTAAIRFPIPGTQLAVEPGAVIGLGLLGAAAIIPGKKGDNDPMKNKNLTLRSGIASLGGGMLVVETGKLAAQTVGPAVQQALNPQPQPCPAGQVPGPNGTCVPAGAFIAGMPRGAFAAGPPQQGNRWAVERALGRF